MDGQIKKLWHREQNHIAFLLSQPYDIILQEIPHKFTIQQVGGELLKL